MKLNIPIIVGFDDMESLLDDLKKLQTYKLFEGAEMVLVDIEDVAKVLMDHVKAKKSVTTDDLISRQQAIDTAVTFVRRTLLDSKPIDVKMSSDYIFVNLVEPMRKLPTAQPETNCSEFPNNSDTISRQAAIDALDKRFDSIPMEQTTEILLLRKDLRDLPSAQPEVIRCKDCKWFEYDHPYVVYGIPVLGHLICNKWGDGCRTNEDGFCFMAERRTDE